MTAHDRIRVRLDNWRFWMVIAYFALAFLVVWGIKFSSTLANEQATRKATVAANATGEYRRCRASIPQLTKINLFLRGEADLANTIVRNSAALVNSTPKDDPQYQTRLANLRRIREARDKIVVVDGFRIPTVAECKERLAISRGG